MLNDVVTVRCDGVPLKWLAPSIEKGYTKSVRVELDEEALREAGIPLDQPVSCDVKDVPLREALRRILEPLKLVVVFRQGRLLITTESRRFKFGDLVATTRDGCDVAGRTKKTATLPKGSPCMVLGRGDGRLFVEFGEDKPHAGWIDAGLLDQSDVTDAGLAHLRACKRLSSIDLAECTLSDEGLGHLVGLPELRSLSASGMALSSRGLAQLKTLPKIEKLYELEFNGSKIAGEDLAQLKDCPNLRTLSITKFDPGDAGLRHLPTLLMLQSLILSDTRLTNADLKELKRLRSLHYLGFDASEITPEGLAHLKQLRKSTTIMIHGIKITDQTVAQLKKLSELRFWVETEHITEQQVKELNKALWRSSFHKKESSEKPSGGSARADERRPSPPVPKFDPTDNVLVVEDPFAPGAPEPPKPGGDPFAPKGPKKADPFGAGEDPFALPKHAGPAKADSPGPPIPGGSAKLDRILNAEANDYFFYMPRNLAGDLRRTYGIEAELTPAAAQRLRKAGFRSHLWKNRDVSLRSALKLMLAPLGLTYTVRDGNVVVDVGSIQPEPSDLFVTTAENTELRLPEKSIARLAMINRNVFAAGEDATARKGDSLVTTKTGLELRRPGAVIAQLPKGTVVVAESASKAHVVGRVDSSKLRGQVRRDKVQARVPEETKRILAADRRNPPWGCTATDSPAGGVGLLRTARGLDDRAPADVLRAGRY